MNEPTPPASPSDPTGPVPPALPGAAGPYGAFAGVSPGASSSPTPGAPRGNGGAIAAAFLGGLALVAGVTWLALGSSPTQSPYGSHAASSADPYALPFVPGLERRRPSRGPAAGATATRPGKGVEPRLSEGSGAANPIVPDGPAAAPIFAPARAPTPPGSATRPADPTEGGAPRAPDLPQPGGDPASLAPVPEDRSVPTPTPGGSSTGTAPGSLGAEPGTALAAGPSGAHAPPTTPTREAIPEAPTDWRILLTGDAADTLAMEASRLAEERRLVTPKGRLVRFSPRAGEAPGARQGARFVIDRQAAALTLTEIRIPETLEDPIAALVPPVGLVPDVLVGIPLPVAGPSQAAAVAAMALLLAGDGPTAAGLLDAKPTEPGQRVLRAYALLLGGELPRVHELLFGLGDDPNLGVVARFLTGAALLTDRNPREAIRDFQAASKLRPTFWPARLLEAESNARLDLPEAAAPGFAAVLAAVPDRPEAILSHAFYLAGKDRPAAVAAVEGLTKARPDLVAAWWMLGWIRRQGETSEDARAEVKAFETVVFLRPKDPGAWRELGTARLRWADGAGGLDARRAAAAAFAEQVALQPKDGLAWFNRGSVLHQLATEVPLAGDAEAFARRLEEVRACYAKALEAGTLSKPDAARVHHNVGLVLDLLPAGAGGTSASTAYQAAIDADPTYAQGALALVAARVAEGDGAAAAKAMARIPADADATERSVLAAAVRWVGGDAPGAAVALREAGESPLASGDLALRVLGGLVVTGYRRAALTHLVAQPADVPRLKLRVHARAGLRDVAGLRADLAALGKLDARLAEQLRARDPEVLATLGPPPGTGSPEDRVR